MLTHDLERRYHTRLGATIDRLRQHPLLNQPVPHKGRRKRVPMGHRLAGLLGSPEPDEELPTDIARLITPGVLGRAAAVGKALDAIFLAHGDLEALLQSGPDMARRGAFQQHAPPLRHPPHLLPVA